MVVLVLASGCAKSFQEDLVVSYTWLGGEHEALLIDTFGKDVTYQSTNIYKLSNAWNQVDPNALNIKGSRVRYVDIKDGIRRIFDYSTEECPKLRDDIAKLDKNLRDSISMIVGSLNYPKTNYLDSPDYLIEVYNYEGQIRLGKVDASLPVVEDARSLINTVEECSAA